MPRIREFVRIQVWVGVGEMLLSHGVRIVFFMGSTWRNLSVVIGVSSRRLYLGDMLMLIVCIALEWKLLSKLEGASFASVHVAPIFAEGMKFFFKLDTFDSKLLFIWQYWRTEMPGIGRRRSQERDVQL